MTKPKYLLGPTKLVRVPIDLADEICDLALVMDKAVWEARCVFTLGSLHSHRPRVEKLLRKLNE